MTACYTILMSHCQYIDTDCSNWVLSPKYSKLSSCNFTKRIKVFQLGILQLTKKIQAIHNIILQLHKMDIGLPCYHLVTTQKDKSFLDSQLAPLQREIRIFFLLILEKADLLSASSKSAALCLLNIPVAFILFSILKTMTTFPPQSLHSQILPIDTIQVEYSVIPSQFLPSLQSLHFKHEVRIQKKTQ